MLRLFFMTLAWEKGKAYLQEYIPSSGTQYSVFTQEAQ